MSFQSTKPAREPHKHWANFFFLTALTLIFVAMFFEWFDESFPGFDRRWAFAAASMAAVCLFQSFRELVRADSDWMGPLIIAGANAYAWLLLPMPIAFVVSGATALVVSIVAGVVISVLVAVACGWFDDDRWLGEDDWHGHMA